MPKRTLTNKAKRFGQEYLTDFNATQSAIRAGYSKKTAYSAGQRLLKKVEVQEYIQALNKKVSDKLEITQERIKRELAKISFFNIKNLYDEKGNLKRIIDLDDDTAAAIGGIDVDEIKFGELKIGETRKMKIIDKKGALDSLAKIESMFTENLNIGAKVKIIKDDI